MWLMMQVLDANPDLPKPQDYQPNDCIALPMPYILPRLIVSQPGQSLHSITRTHGVAMLKMLRYNMGLLEAQALHGDDAFGPGWVLIMPGLKGYDGGPSDEPVVRSQPHAGTSIRLGSDGWEVLEQMHQRQLIDPLLLQAVTRTNAGSAMSPGSASRRATAVSLPVILGGSDAGRETAKQPLNAQPANSTHPTLIPTMSNPGAATSSSTGRYSIQATPSRSAASMDLSQKHSLRNQEGEPVDPVFAALTLPRIAAPCSSLQLPLPVCKDTPLKVVLPGDVHYRSPCTQLRPTQRPAEGSMHARVT